jgi:predicted NAD/FAD-binding protein
MKIAVIGSGIAGLSSAWCLAKRHDLTLFEADARVGGHTNTIEVPLADGRVQPVDTGWIVYNGKNYPNLTALFEELDVRTRPTGMSFAVSLGNGAYEWKGSDQIFTVFAQASNLFNPTHLRMLIDLLRMNRRAKKILASGQLPSGSLGDWLAAEGYSRALMSRYLLPMAGLIWSCSPAKAAEYPVDDFMRFFDSHSLFNTVDQPQWRVVVGGSHTYVKALLEEGIGTLRLNTPVRGLRRVEGGVEVQTDAGSERFDQVICATHADQALALLDQPREAEREMLAGMPYNASRCVLHTDESFLPKRRLAWGAWNYLHPRDEIHDQPISGSYWMNALQHIPGPVNYIVTLNPQREIPAEKVLYDTVYHHPHYGAASVRSHALLPELQGHGGLWWCGAWTAYGFHEDGLKSGLRVVQGIDPKALPEWASLS